MTEQKDYHVAGAAGIGMSAIAQVLLAQGHAVSGSDRYLDQGEDLPVLRKLKASGIHLVKQDGSGVTGSDCTVVVSSAVEDDNPDVVEARKCGAEIVARGEMLARLAADKNCIAVAGTCGKTTVTGMLGWILQELGRDPTVVNGGAVLDWCDDDTVGNVRTGESDLWVVEADESDKSLLHLNPDWAIVTNESKDHFDVDETAEVFTQFRAQVKNGVVEGPEAEKSLCDVVQDFSGASFRYRGMPFRINLPGAHNIQNAVSAISLCDSMGCDLAAVSDAIASFKGIERRLQIVGTAGGTTVIDDFGHNPAKIRAAWESVAPYFKRVFAVWRPHGFGPLAFMMEDLIKEFGELCSDDDRICILPVYYAGGTAKKTVTSWNLVAEMRAKNIPAFYAGDYQILIQHLMSRAGDGDAVLVMGARDPNLPALARQIVSKAGLIDSIG